MTFIRRFTEFPSIEVLSEIEAVNIIDQTPPAPIVGVGSGTLLLVGEFEDGPFAVKGGDAAEIAAALYNAGVSEVFGQTDLQQKFGLFGFLYGELPSQNPCARRHLTEFWNGNGFLKLKYLRSPRLIIARVDTSVGSVSIAPLAAIDSGSAGPWDLAVGDTLSITSQAGTDASTALAATQGEALGVAGTFPTLFAGGEALSVALDGGPAVRVTFEAADQTAAQVVARINLVLGGTYAAVAGGQVRIRGTIFGTDGDVTLANVSGTPIATLGLTAGAHAGTGNVGNIDAVTAAELATIINADAGLGAIFVSARALPDGSLRVFSETTSTGTIQINASLIATALGFTLATAIAAGVHAAGTIPAGTRVTDGVTTWVTMQSLVIAEGTSTDKNVGPHIVKVRPGLDDGTALGCLAAACSTLTDQPAFSECAVTNAAALAVAKSEALMDNAYISALDATLDLTSASRQANISLVARRSGPVAVAARQNAIDASAEGMYGRSYILGAPLGFTQAQAQADVADYRSDRLWYTWPGWQVRVPEIAAAGAAVGGAGFTDDGIITVRSDGPLASICCQLAPEENPAQATGLIENFFAIEAIGVPLGITAYTALKAAGICAPISDPDGGQQYQSGVTSSLTSGRTTIARRKMSDFIQDSQARALVPYSKKLNTTARREGVLSTLQDFLRNLQSPNAPERARIGLYSIRVGGTPDMTALGIVVYDEQVQTLPSMDALVLNTQIGEGVVVITES